MFLNMINISPKLGTTFVRKKYTVGRVGMEL